MITAEKVFERYEELRPRLPVSSPRQGTKALASLLEISEEIDAFVFDAFGVLNIGNIQIPGANKRLQQLRSKGHLIRILTNAASYEKSGALDKFRRLGIEVETNEIVTSRDAAMKLADSRLWGVIATPEDGLSDLRGQFIRLSDHAEAFDRTEGFLFLSSADWTMQRQGLLEASLQQKPRRVIIANADLVAPREGRFSLEPGFFGQRISDHIDTEVLYFGKPFPDVYKMVEESLPGIDPNRVAICGDTLHTDILGGLAAGWQSVFVTGDGLFAGRNASVFVEKSGIWPHYQLHRI
ncbi:MAG: HAD-IIA family hydrolase [Pseudomonadota bacterium]